jgi:glycosyltransferase involved in cell wall biosynthesis
MRSLFVEHSAKIRIIPNGLPSDVFFPAGDARKPTNRRYKILYVGQLIPLKGLDVLLEAVRHVADRHDVELLLVYHNAALEEECTQRTRELGLVDRVQFLGIKSGRELAELYRDVDMHVLPSFTESLPGVITEAMLSGLPVVASAVGGVPEQVGRHARLVEPGNVAELAAAIERTLDDIAEGKIDPVEIRDYARSQFRTEVMVERHLRLYEELAQSKSGPVRRQVRYRPANAAAQFALTAIGATAQGRGWLEG